MADLNKMSSTQKFNRAQYKRAEKAHATNPATSFSKPEAKSIHRHNAKHNALVARTKGHKHGEREARSKKAGFYVNGHKNYGDVYEA